MFYLDSYLTMMEIMLLMVGVLLGVALLTLFERKVLGYIQIRKGPNKVGYLGIFQPFSDAIKLFSKEQMYPFMSNFLIYYYSPVFNLFLSLMLWLSMPFISVVLSFSLSFMFFLCCSSLTVYTVMLAGWSSNSMYALLGGLRAVAQSISYEVSLAMILLSFLFLILSLSMMDLFYYQEFFWLLYLMFPLCLLWLISCLAETNRIPFDFAEGESELVSGFNVEYSSSSFALIFLAEYSSILFMSMLCCIMFLGSNLSDFIFFMKLVLLAFIWIWIRGTIPRFRYDKLMYLCWKGVLPISLNMLMFFFMLKYFYMIRLI